MSSAGLRALVGPVIAGSLVMCASALHWLAPLESFARDVLLRTVPERPARHVAVVAIDEASLLREGAWPWPRQRLAALVQQAASSGATVIGIDLLLHDVRAGDAELSAACRRSRCVAATTLDERGEWILPAATLRRDLHPAHAAFELDDDGIFRRISITKQDRKASFPAFSVQLASLATVSPIAPGRAVTPGFRTPPRSLPVVSASAVLRGESHALATLRGRAVIVGVTAVALGDRAMTPRSRRHETDPGVLVHGAALESLLTGDLFREMSPLTAGFLAAVLAWLAVRVCRREDARWRISGETAVILTPAGAAAGFMFAHTFVPVVALSVAVTVTVIAAEAGRALRMMRHGRAAVVTLERDLGARPADINSDVGQRLEALASTIVRHRARDTESKRVLAHELKTPLSAMHSLSQLLTGFDLTPAERQRVAALLGDEAVKLQEMVSRLLEIEQLALAGRPESSAPINLGDVVSSRAAFLSRGIPRPIEVSSEPEIFISGDASLIERVVDNLIGNAVKYSPQGSPVVLGVRRESAVALIEVMDRGPGIPPAERARIFGSFARGTTAAGTEGLGLGLALVAEAVRWHGGSVDVNDREGGGSIFRVRLPAFVAEIAEAV
ncbi:MAG: CHASE2 domain-containing protein [Thermoanaerobaculia bacterium]